MKNARAKIYAIKHKGKVIYIGQTRNKLDDRFWKHMSSANGKGGSRSPKLYPHILANNFEGYTFECLEFCHILEMNEREKFYIEKFGTMNECNSTPGGISARGSHHYMTKPVRREDGEIFESLKDAAASIGVSGGAIWSAIKHKQRSGGYRWEYLPKPPT